ncbi:MAG: Asp-tRNA(Asn)/Glu-tRNA(Gln) amidotransferase subunit GatC [Acidimicrobiia bacterium]|nr:Asp-tRNA(Asn)/Glu-tRNA(Gln) amidotransferase subunit GatC [Acidimicrobiia bacterium]
MTGERITRDDVEHVARLARLALTDDEVALFSEQLSVILEHAARVSALPTEGVPPSTHPLPLRNVLRPDQVGPTLDRGEVLAQAPEAEDDRIRVPRIFGEEQ